MKANSKIEFDSAASSVPAPRSVQPVYAYCPPADTTSAGATEAGSVYRCKNCGKQLQLSETVNFYGIPACPVCVNAGAPFEIVRELG